MSQTEPTPSAGAEPTIHGVLAEFDSVDSVTTAATAVRDAGYKRFDVHSPFPIHGIDKVCVDLAHRIGHRRSVTGLASALITDQRDHRGQQNDRKVGTGHVWLLVRVGRFGLIAAPATTIRLDRVGKKLAGKNHSSNDLVGFSRVESEIHHLVV